MKSRTIIKCIFLFLLVMQGGLIYAAVDSLRLNADLIYYDDGDFYNDIYCSSDDSFSSKVKISCYQFQNNGDSILAYQVIAPKVHFQKGINKTTLSFKENNGKHYLLPAFGTIVKQYNLIPPGKYIIRIQVLKDSILISKMILHEVDSTLNPSSSVYRGITKIFENNVSRLSSSGVLLNFFRQRNESNALMPDAEKVLMHSRFYIVKYCKRNKLSCNQYSNDACMFVDIYKDSWFIGRYKLFRGQPVASQIKRARDALEEHASSIVNNDLGDYRSLASQFREIIRNDKGNKELVGTINLSANICNDREPYSGEANNYYEANGLFEFPIFDIPIQIEGYYTSQDRNRQVKSSYIHFHYDAEKAKEKLLGLISSYNKRYEQTLSQGASFKMIYGSYINQLEDKKALAFNKLKEEIPVSTWNETQFQQQLKAKVNVAEDSISKLMVGKADSSSEYKEMEKAKEAIHEKYQRVLHLYEKIKTYEGKIDHYRQLLQQYKNTLYYDSALVYQKLKTIRNADNLSYKEIANQASTMLPEGKVKGLVSGLTNFDAGMFPMYLSEYTMAGQMMKGLNVGYDVGVAKIGLTYGNTEYISGYDDVTTYKSYSARATFKPIANQNIGIVYYGYSPARKLLEKNDFFKSEEMSLPSFRNPVHIMSAIYSGKITNYINLNGEFAFSNEQGQSHEASGQISFNERSSYNIQIVGNIPNTTLNLDALYEHSGKSFENSTLPVLMSGTQKIMISGSGELFRSYLSVAVNYNHLLQNSLYAVGNNTQWGFDIGTRFKRLPNVFLSYKPFSSFRSFTDTLNIPQKPILGSVWIGRTSYQIKKIGRAWHFSILFNNNNSLIDTIKYNSTLVQGSAMYSNGATVTSVNIGVSKINANTLEEYAALNNNEFASVNASFPVINNVNISTGVDAAICQFGWNKLGGSIGGVYTFKKIPIIVQMNFRNSNYRLKENTDWKSLYFGTIQMSWRFKLKLKDK